MQELPFQQTKMIDCLGGSPAGHIPMIHTCQTLSLVRKYLNLDLDLVEQEVGMQDGELEKVEQGLYSPPARLVVFYAESLRVSPRHLLAILKNDDSSIGSNIIRKFIYLYFSLVLKLRKYEKSKTL